MYAYPPNTRSAGHVHRPPPTLTSDKEPTWCAARRLAEGIRILRLRSGFIVSFALLLLTPTSAWAQNTIGTVNVYGSFPGDPTGVGGNGSPEVPHTPEPRIGDGDGGTVPVDCSGLEGERPDGCSPEKGAAPPSPGYAGVTESDYANRFANGCGDQAGLASTVSLFIPTGNLNEPIEGLNFSGACRNHDACYAAQRGQSVCDAAFRTALMQVASRHPDRERAEDWGRRYASSVEAFGGFAYSASTRLRACAEWHDAMLSGNCFK